MLNNFCGSVTIGGYRGIASRARLWTPGTELRVLFRGGTPALQERILATAKEWEKWAFIKFKRVESGDAEVRVGCDYGRGCWSLVGRDCLKPEFAQMNSMNLSWIGEDTSEVEFKRVVLHEFGHVLGLEHEHKSPKSPIVWNEAAVIDYFKAAYGWDQVYTRMNVLDRVVEPYESTEFDPHSIMLYPIAPELTIDGQGIPWLNSDLSECDKLFVSNLYPGGNRRVVVVK